MTVSNTPPVIVDKAPVVKDSLKFAGTDTTFSIVDIVPSSDSAPSQGTAYSTQIEEMLSTMKALQVARKSLSQAQSLVKDIKSNYKVEKYDEWSPLDDSLLLQRRGFMLQIRDIFEKALYDNQNVFTIDYTTKGVNIDLDKHSLKGLNLRDGHSIDIFSYNLQALSKQMDNEIGNLQKKIDSINQTRWLPESQLKGLPLEQKTVSTDNSKDIPNLASLLALSGAPTSAAASPSPLEEAVNKVASQDSTAPKDNATETMKEVAKPEDASLATSSAQDTQADTQDKSNEAMQEDTTKAPKAGDAPSENKETSPASNEGGKDGESAQGIASTPDSKTTSMSDSAPTSQEAQSETKEEGAEVSTESKDAKAPESKEDSPQVGTTNDSKPSEPSQATLSESGKQDEPKGDSKASIDKDSNSAPSQDAPSIAAASPSDATNESNLEASTTSAELGAEAKTDSKDAPQANLATNTPSPDGATDTATNNEDKKDEQKPSDANNQENEENKKEEKQASQATPNEETKPSDGGDTMLVIENA